MAANHATVRARLRRGRRRIPYPLRPFGELAPEGRKSLNNSGSDVTPSFSLMRAR